MKFAKALLSTILCCHGFAQLLCNMQNLVATTSAEFEWQQIKISIEFGLLWNIRLISSEIDPWLAFVQTVFIIVEPEAVKGYGFFMSLMSWQFLSFQVFYYLQGSVMKHGDGTTIFKLQWFNI